MTPQDLEILQAIRILLVGGLFFVGLILGVDLLGQPMDMSGMKSRVRPVVDEECKLHARKLSECKRLGYHEDKTDDPDDA